MIPVVRQPEYGDFDREVRQPGLAFLARTRRPTTVSFRRGNYWSRARPHLRAAYSGQCAYTTMYLVDGGAVDHFLPKAKYPRLAYEWTNYRLARQKVNGHKGNTEGVVDPFDVEVGWFVLRVPSCLICPGDELSGDLRRRVKTTINVLRLNADDLLVQERCNLLVELADGNVTMEFLDRWYPFLSTEVRRQDIEDDLRVVFSRLTP